MGCGRIYEFCIPGVGDGQWTPLTRSDIRRKKFDSEVMNLPSDVSTVELQGDLQVGMAKWWLDTWGCVGHPCTHDSLVFFFFFPTGLHNFRDLSSPARDQTPVKAPSPNHWTTRELPSLWSFKLWACCFFSGPPGTWSHLEEGGRATWGGETLL